MPKASVKRLIECKKKNLINLVLDIEKYPKFVPFCLDAKIYEKKDKDEFIFIIADLTIGKGPFKDTYKSDVKFNKKEKDDLILIIADLTIGKGPFKDTYKSDVKFNKKDNSIYVTNLDGPLKYLKNHFLIQSQHQKKLLLYC